MAEPGTGDDLSRPVVVAIGVGMAMMVSTALVGIALWQLFLLGDGFTCLEGLCAFWAYYGVLSAGPAFAICGVTAWLAARVATLNRQVARTQIWRFAFIAATVAWLIAVAIGLTVHVLVFGQLPPGPESLFHRLFG